jgi:hypothetical protein
MCFFAFNWTANCWQFRIGGRWTDFRGVRSWTTLEDVEHDVALAGLVLAKTDSRTYELQTPLDYDGKPRLPPRKRGTAGGKPCKTEAVAEDRWTSYLDCGDA